MVFENITTGSPILDQIIAAVGVIIIVGLIVYMKKFRKKQRSHSKSIKNKSQIKTFQDIYLESNDTIQCKILLSFPNSSFNNPNPWMTDTEIANKLGKNKADIFRHCELMGNDNLIKAIHFLTDNSVEYEITESGKKRRDSCQKIIE